MDYITKYKPTLPELLNDFDINPDLSREDYAFEAWKMLLVAKRNSDAMFLVIGKLLKDVRDKKLFEVLDYESFNSFLSSEELGFSREKAYLCIRAYEYLVEHLALDPEKVGQLNIGRINQMLPYVKKIEEEQGREEAIKQIENLDSLRHGDFIRKINEERKSSKPQVYWLEEKQMWKVDFWGDMTELFDKGIFNGGSYEA